MSEVRDLFFFWDLLHDIPLQFFAEMGCFTPNKSHGTLPRISHTFLQRFAWSHGSQPRAAATDLRLRTRGLAGVSGAGVWKIPAVGYHPAGASGTPELWNSRSAEIPMVKCFDKSNQVGIQEP